MYCIKCGTKLELDANFCIECGNKTNTIRDDFKLNPLVNTSDISGFDKRDAEKEIKVRDNYQFSNQNNTSNYQLEWYYESNGKRHGPVDSNHIKDLLMNNTIDRDTLIWCKDFEDWKKIIQTEFRTSLEEPPPLVGNKVDNNFIWLLAFAPIIGILIELILIENSIILTDAELFFVYFILNSSLAVIDDIKLKNAGYKTDNLVWAIFLVPVYIWKRATFTKQSRAYFWVWIIFMCINFIFTLAIYTE